MFVINSNQNKWERQASGLYDYGNKYPDFDQLLLFMQWPFWSWWQQLKDITPEEWTFPKAITIGSKSINYIFANNTEKNIFGSPTWTDLWANSTLILAKFWYETHTRTTRFWTAWQLKAWHIIGENVIRRPYFVFSGQSYTVNSFTMTVWLLHTDWTISYCTPINISWYVWKSIREMIVGTDTWIVSQDGDRVIVDFSINAYMEYNEANITTTSWLLWSATIIAPSVQQGAPSPIQVSIRKA